MCPFILRYKIIFLHHIKSLPDMTYAGMLMIYFFKIYYREIRLSGEKLGGCEMYEQTHMKFLNPESYLYVGERIR